MFDLDILELDILSYLSHDLLKNEFFAMYNTEKLAWTYNHVGVVSKVINSVLMWHSTFVTLYQTKIRKYLAVSVYKAN